MSSSNPTVIQPGSPGQALAPANPAGIMSPDMINAMTRTVSAFLAALPTVLGPEECVNLLKNLIVDPDLLEVMTALGTQFADSFTDVTVENKEQYTAVVQKIQEGRECIDTVTSRFTARKKLADHIHKWILAVERATVLPIVEKIEPADRNATTWWNAEERKRLAREAEERRERERREELQRIERQRLIDEETERQRIRLHDEQLAVAIKIEERGETELANQVLETPGEVDISDVVAALPPVKPQEAVVIADERPKLPGRGYRTGKFTYRIIEGSEHLIPERYWLRTVNEKLIKAEVETQGSACRIPGIEVFQLDATAVNRRTTPATGRK